MNAKSYRKELLADSLLIVLPLFLGFFLPVSSESALRITWQFVFPLTTLGTFWLIAYLGIWKGRFETMKPDVVRWTLFLQPMISLAVCAMFVGLEYFPNWNGLVFVNGMLALIFLVCGNLLPKISQNEMIGIRTRWALENADNWNYTQRVGGRIWVVCGLIMLGACFFPNGTGVIVVLALIASALSVFVSWKYAQIQKAHGVVFSKPKPFDKKNLLWLLLGVPPLIFALVIVFAGDYTVRVDRGQIALDANFVSDTVVPFDEIESITMEPDSAPGTRVNGYAARSILMGRFENDAFGRYTRYTKGNGDVIVIQTKEGTVVFNEASPSKTKALYRQIRHEKETSHRGVSAAFFVDHATKTAKYESAFHYN